MKEAVRHYLDKYKRAEPIVSQYFEEVDLDAIHLYLDVTTEPREIIKIIHEHKKRFLFIVSCIVDVTRRRNDELYRREGNVGNVFAMRFKEPNSRIYCQEISVAGKRYIVMSRGLFYKKDTPAAKIAALEKDEFKFYSRYEQTNEFKKQQKKKQKQ